MKVESHISIIFFADIVGYTSMMEQNHQEALSKLQIFEETISAETEKLGGEIIKSYGDGCLVLFKSAVNAVHCAINIQKRLKEEPKVPLRIGIHIGEIARKENDVFGNGVNIASRIESMGIPNSIVISEDLHLQVKNHTGVQAVKLGLFRFKNVERDIQLYAISNDGINVPSLGDMKGKGESVKALSFKTTRRTRKLVIPIIILALIGVSYILTRSQANQEVHKIAVLPLKNISQNDSLEYFSDGLTQEIINELGNINQIQASAFSSTIVYKAVNKSLKEIAEELDVSLILSGSSIKDEDSVQLSMELINPESNDLIWNERYADKFSGSIHFQKDIARKVVNQLDIKLSRKEREKLDALPTTSIEAFDLFLKAKSEYLKMTTAGIYKSIEFLDKAIELDPDYAQAYTLLAWVHFLSGINGYMSTDEVLKRTEYPLEKAISLDPDNADNYLIKAGLNIYLLNDLSSAKQDVDKAIALNKWPKIPTDYCMCIAVLTYTAVGDLERASELAKLSKKIDPLNATVFVDEGTLHILKGEYDKAIPLMQQGLEFVDNEWFNYSLGWAYYHNQDYVNALIFLEKAQFDDIGQPHPIAIAFLSNAYFKIGDLEQSEKYRHIMDYHQSQGLPNFNMPLSMVYATRGDNDMALNYLKKAYEERETGFAYYLNIFPVFDLLKENKEFIELRNKVGFEKKETFVELL